MPRSAATQRGSCLSVSHSALCSSASSSASSSTRKWNEYQRTCSAQGPAQLTHSAACKKAEPASLRQHALSPRPHPSSAYGPPCRLPRQGARSQCKPAACRSSRPACLRHKALRGFGEHGQAQGLGAALPREAHPPGLQAGGARQVGGRASQRCSAPSPPKVLRPSPSTCR